MKDRAYFRERAKARRARLVAAGLCGNCGQRRGKLAWLCDQCAEAHREAQRHRNAMAQEREPQ